MTEIQIGSFITIVRGPFKDYQGVVSQITNSNIIVELDIFGHKVPVPLQMEDFDIDCVGPLDRFRRLMEEDITRTLHEQLQQWWIDKLPFEQNNPVGEWEEFIEYQEQLEVITNQKKEALLNEFAHAFAAVDKLGFDWARQKWQAEEQIWLPFTHLYNEKRRQWRENKDKDSFSIMPTIDDPIFQAHQRWWEAESQAWRYKNLPSEETSLAMRQKALEEAQLLVEEMRTSFHKHHGLILPDHVFTFWAFWLSLNDTLKEVMDFIGVLPTGIFDTFSDKEEYPIERDYRSKYSHYNDPPEFLTVLSGNCDGRHFGLWYDDPANEPIGVMSYYSSDGDGIGNNGAKTLLEEVRYEIESASTMDSSFISIEEYRLIQIQLSALRDHVMLFETGERLETGDKYLETYRECISEKRIVTVDYAGVFIPGCFLERDRDNIRTAILNDDPIVDTWIESALQKCNENQPVHALTLGRDLHWLSCKNPQRETAAAKLLEAAYKALNRDALASIAILHHQFRNWINSVYTFD